jgi:hypothetical protein
MTHTWDLGVEFRSTGEIARKSARHSPLDMPMPERRLHQRAPAGQRHIDGSKMSRSVRMRGSVTARRAS